MSPGEIQCLKCVFLVFGWIARFQLLHNVSVSVLFLHPWLHDVSGPVSQRQLGIIFKQQPSMAQIPVVNWSSLLSHSVGSYFRKTNMVNGVEQIYELHLPTSTLFATISLASLQTYRKLHIFVFSRLENQRILKAIYQPLPTGVPSYPLILPLHCFIFYSHTLISFK